MPQKESTDSITPDPDQTVWKVPSRNSKRRYHLDPQCPDAQRAFVLRPKQYKELNDRFICCKRCAGGMDGDERTKTFVTCPSCNTSIQVERFRSHHPCPEREETVSAPTVEGEM